MLYNNSIIEIIIIIWLLYCIFNTFHYEKDLSSFFVIILYLHLLETFGFYFSIFLHSLGSPEISITYN